jgi:ATP-dependent Lon protease
LLELSDVVARLEKLMLLMESEADLFELEKNIRVRVKQQMEKNQREYYLNEQMKAIQKELGDMEDAVSEVEELEQKIAQAGMSKDAKEKAGAELNKLKMMSSMSAEASVVRNYIGSVKFYLALNQYRYGGDLLFLPRHAHHLKPFLYIFYWLLAL